MMQRKTRLALMAGGALAILVVAGVGLAMAHPNLASGAPWPRGFARSSGFTDTDGSVAGTFVTFTADPAAGALRDLDLKDGNSTHPLVASVTIAPAAGAGFTGSTAAKRGPHGGGYALDDGAGDRLVVQDSPRAGFAAHSANGTTVTLVLPEGATITMHEAVDAWSPAGATVDYGNGQKANLVLGKDATLAQDGQTLTVTLAAGGHLVYGLVPDGAYAMHPGMGHGPGLGMGPRGGHGFGHRGHR